MAPYYKDQILNCKLGMLLIKTDSVHGAIPDVLEGCGQQAIENLKIYYVLQVLETEIGRVGQKCLTDSCEVKKEMSEEFRDLLTLTNMF